MHKVERNRHWSGPVALLAITLVLSPDSAVAETCLTIENVKGQSAHTSRNYKMRSSAFDEVFTFCYEGDKGEFEYYGGVHERFGSDTWIWINVLDDEESTHVWTFDFTYRKAFYAKTTLRNSPVSSSVSAFVGDITAIKAD